MLSIARRNIMMFFRDRTSVFFSLLSIIIIIGLYVLFLGNLMAADMANLPKAHFLTDSWIMAGILSVASITTTMGAFGIMVEDRFKKIIKDFSSSPLKRSSLVGGYILSSYVIGMIISVIAFVLAELYIVAYGGESLSLKGILTVLGLLLLSVLAGSSIVFFIVSFLKSQNAFATASTIIGTLIGFVTGIYVPIGAMPDSVQWVIKVFPISHASLLFRRAANQHFSRYE